MSSLNRCQVTLHRSHAEADDGGYMPGTAEERFLEVWELTREVWAFFQETDAEQRLQRDVAVLANKRASGRMQDLADVEKLQAVQPHNRKP